MASITIAFFVGSTLGTVVAMFMAAAIHGRQARAWQAEYRRLMGGIDRVGFNILMRLKEQHSSNQNYRLLEKTAALLKQIHDGGSV